MNRCEAAWMYHAGSRSLQDAFDARRLADRLQERLTRTALTSNSPGACGYKALPPSSPTTP